MPIKSKKKKIIRDGLVNIFVVFEKVVELMMQYMRVELLTDDFDWSFYVTPYCIC